MIIAALHSLLYSKQSFVLFVIYIIQSYLFAVKGGFSFILMNGESYLEKGKTLQPMDV